MAEANGKGSGGAPSATRTRAESPNAQEGNPGYIPRPKRIACVVCRKRKLRCDGTKPSCGNCSRLGHDCAYSEVRKKSGPKRGYVKHLEARLAQVETLLKGVDNAENAGTSPPTRPFDSQNDPSKAIPQSALPPLPSIPNSVEVDPNLTLDDMDMFRDTGDVLPQQSFGGQNTSSPTAFSWEMIGLGLEEPLPSQEVIDELDEIYFHKIHPTTPMINKPRYYAAMNLAPSMRPPVCLRYIMWANAAATTDKYMNIHTHFYQRARKYIELDQMKGLGESTVSVAHAQCWVLIGCYEFKMMYFPRAWLSTGTATRLSLMMGFNRQDSYGLDVKQCLPAPRDWTEREERRRTFWAAFCQDRYASAGTGWPMTVDERDILTNLPASDEAYLTGTEQQTPSLADIMSGQEASSLSSFAATVLLANMFGRNLHHIHRVTANDKDDDLNGDFWKRHRALDNILLHTSLSLPNHLRLPEGIADPDIVFSNMCIHTSTICLHQAAMYKAEKHNLPSQISTESKRRCIIAADQIANIMKMVSHIDLTTLNPFMAFCLYVAARVFVQYLKSRPRDQAIRSSLQFLLSAMNAIKRKVPLAESFLAQLDVELEGSGVLTDEDGVSRFSYSSMHKSPEDYARESALRAVRSQFEKCTIAIIDVALMDKDNVPNGTSKSPTIGSLSDSQESSLSVPKPLTQGVPPNTQSYGLKFPTTIPDLRMPNVKDDQFNYVDFHMTTSTGGGSSGSERHHSYSDNPSPNTNISSSNGSFSPHNPEQSSPGSNQHTQQQQQAQHVPTSLAYTTNGSNASYGAGAHNLEKTNALHFSSGFSPAPSGPQLAPQSLFPMPNGWDFLQQPSQLDSDLIPPTPSSSTMEAVISSLQDVPWSQHTDFNVNEWTK